MAGLKRCAAIGEIYAANVPDWETTLRLAVLTLVDEDILLFCAVYLASVQADMWSPVPWPLLLNLFQFLAVLAAQVLLSIRYMLAGQYLHPPLNRC